MNEIDAPQKIKDMKNLIGAFWALLLCIVIAMCGGACRTKKIASTESNRRTYDSVQVVKEKADVRYSFIDTTATSEYTRIITEYIFDAPVYDSFAPDINVDSKIPMFVRNADGSLRINYGLKGIRQTEEATKNERKGVSERKDSTGNKVSNTKIRATENKKRKDKQVEQVRVSEPFDWWQILFALCVPFAVVVLLLYLKATPFVQRLFKRIRNALKSE